MYMFKQLYFGWKAARGITSSTVVQSNLSPLHQLAGVAPARVGERTRHTQSNGQKRYDEHCAHKPAEHIDRVEGAHVIHRAIQIQARHHNDNRRHREGDARVGELDFSQACEQPRYQRADKRCCLGRHSRAEAQEGNHRQGSDAGYWTRRRSTQLPRPSLPGC